MSRSIITPQYRLITCTLSCFFFHSRSVHLHSLCLLILQSVLTSTRSEHSFLWPACTQTPSQKHHRWFTAFFSLQVIVDLKGSECTWSYQTPPSSPSTTVSRKSSMCRLVMWLLPAAYYPNSRGRWGGLLRACPLLPSVVNKWNCSFFLIIDFLKVLVYQREITPVNVILPSCLITQNI